ncbi:hypothetical protein CI109_101013 [Kwoniella shandongensis]|uniref:DNA replication regulator SLD2 n=1 Tax=Kwoniella shandongensis TaxID=1734106 RepID=A0AAJ8MUI7_9TREE
MDISSVKATVKAWEKGFKAQNGRDPTKEDIKADPSDIAEQYALYRRLTKSSHSQSLHPPSSSTSAASRNTTTTPRTIPSSEYPTTPTPPSRRASGSYLPSTSTSSRGVGGSSSLNGRAGPSRSKSDNTSNTMAESSQSTATALKRKASRAGLNNHDSSPPPVPLPTARTLFSTPKKKKAYSGPVHDPNPVNPFTSSPASKTSPFKHPSSSNIEPDELTPSSSSAAFRAGASSSVVSPFIHASSPRKLKAVLEANSLRKVKERETVVSVGITPRTRARKRLRGEKVDDTPLKEKERDGWRRRRSSGRSSEEPLDIDFSEGLGGGSKKGSGSGFPFASDDEDDSEEEELGPSPMKALRGEGRKFTSLFGELEAEATSTNTTTSSTTATGGMTQETTSIAKTATVQTKLMMKSTQKKVDQREVQVKANGKGGVKEKTKKEKRRGRPSEMMGFFGRVGQQKDRAKETAIPHDNGNGGLSLEPIDTRPDTIEPSPPTASAPVQPNHAGPSTPPQPSRHRSDSPLATPPPDPLLEEAAMSLLTPSKALQRRDKFVSLSDDEEDEWDPEGGKVMRRVVIVPTRRAVRRRRGSDDLDSASDVESHNEEAEDDLEGDEEEDEEASPSIVREGTTHSSTLPSPTTSTIQHPTSLLHLLTLQSPTKPSSHATARKAKLDELRVKAIFNPFDAAKLKAIKRGQEVTFLGEGADGEEQIEENLLERYEEGDVDDDNDGVGAGEDDWESESEGWKRTEGVMDDEEAW